MEQSLTYIKNILDNGNSQNLAEIFEIKYYQPNFTFGPHSHENVEINYVKTGKCHLKIDGKVISFTRGDCMILYPNVEHYFFTNKEKAILVQLEFRLNIFPHMTPDPELKQNLLFLYQLLTHSQKVIKIRNNAEMNQLIDKAVRELNEKKQNFGILTRLYFAELFVLISRELDKKLNFVSKNIDPHTEAMLQYIQTNFYQEVQFEQFAKETGVSSRYLRKNFKEKMGISPVNYLLEYRINKALELFKGQSLTIKEIAFETGFATQQYFSKKFKEITGLSPNEYKTSLFRKV